MHDKILAALKTKYKDLGLAPKVLDGFAKKLAKTVTEETQLEDAIAGIEDDLQIYQSMSDQHRQQIAAFQKKLDEAVKKAGGDTKQPDQNDQSPQAQAPAGDTPEWAKAILSDNAGLKELVGKLVGEKKADAIRGKVSELLKDIPKIIWNGRQMPESEEGIEAFVESVTTEFAEFSQEQVNQGLQGFPRPTSADPSKAGGKVATATESELKELANRLN